MQIDGKSVYGKYTHFMQALWVWCLFLILEFGVKFVLCTHKIYDDVIQLDGHPGTDSCWWRNQVLKKRCSWRIAINSTNSMTLSWAHSIPTATKNGIMNYDSLWCFILQRHLWKGPPPGEFLSVFLWHWDIICWFFWCITSLWNGCIPCMYLKEMSLDKYLR